MNFVPLSDVFYRLAAFHAFHEFAERPEGITVNDIEAVASYCDKLASYKKRLLLQKRAKAREPDCPAIVQHFLNMLVIRGKSIDTSRRVILERITTCRFPSYVLNETGLATRLEPWKFEADRHSAHAPFRVRNPWRGDELPVYVLKADVKYFVEHGRLKSEDSATTVDQPCTTGQPSPGLDVEPRADDAMARDDQPQQAPELWEPTIAAIGPRPASQSQAKKIWEAFDELRNGLTFKHGELASIGREICEGTDYLPSTAEKIVRAKYLELKKKEKQGPA